MKIIAPNVENGGTTVPRRATIAQATRSGASVRAQFRARGTINIEDLDPAVAQRIRDLQHQIAVESQAENNQGAGGSTRGARLSRVATGYLDAEDSLLQVLRLAGFGYRQIVSVSCKQLKANFPHRLLPN